MIKPVKYLFKRAAKAGAAAPREADEEGSESMRALARGYRSQAEILKVEQQRDKRPKLSG